MYKCININIIIIIIFKGIIAAPSEKKQAKKRVRRIAVQNSHVTGYDFNIIVQANDR